MDGNVTVMSLLNKICMLDKPKAKSVKLVLRFIFLFCFVSFLIFWFCVLYLQYVFYVKAQQQKRANSVREDCTLHCIFSFSFFLYFILPVFVFCFFVPVVCTMCCLVLFWNGSFIHQKGAHDAIEYCPWFVELCLYSGFLLCCFAVLHASNCSVCGGERKWGGGGGGEEGDDWMGVFFHLFRPYGNIIVPLTGKWLVIAFYLSYAILPESDDVCEAVFHVEAIFHEYDHVDICI